MLWEEITEPQVCTSGCLKHLSPHFSTINYYWRCLFTFPACSEECSGHCLWAMHNNRASPYHLFVQPFQAVDNFCLISTKTWMCSWQRGYTSPLGCCSPPFPLFNALLSCRFSIKNLYIAQDWPKDVKTQVGYCLMTSCCTLKYSFFTGVIIQRWIVLPATK